MKFLNCTSTEETEEDIVDLQEQQNGKFSTTTTGKQKTRKNSKIRFWFVSLRNILNNDKENRVEISEPKPLSKDEAAQISGIVEVRSQNEDPPGDQTDHAGHIQLPPNDSVVESDANKIDVGTNQKEDHSKNNNNNLITLNDNENGNLKHFKQEDDILNYGWYWGDISRRDAENLLRGRSEGTFLVRQSSDKRFLYSLSFRSNGKTLHTRIEVCNGLFYFYSNDSSSKQEVDGSSSLVDLITDAMNQNNAENVFFYSRGLHKDEASLHTITLVKPLSRFQYVVDYDSNNNNNDQHKSLQYLCKFLIHHSSIAQAKLESNRHLLSDKLNEFLNEIQLFPIANKK